VKRDATLNAAAFGVSRETEEKLRSYLALLRRWNERINLVAEASEAEQWERHVLDSLQLFPLLPEHGEPIVDLGSGAGLPGLVLAVASGRETHLVESDRRKAAFLSEAGRHLDLPKLQVHAARIEHATLPPAKVLTARALASLPDLLTYAHRLMAPGGVALLPKGRTVEAELTAASAAWTMATERFPSRTEPSATILRIREIHPARVQA
jgi:16S rRNA (guanine(527)-N(7))-methyltransferase RsmG